MSAICKENSKDVGIITPNDTFLSYTSTDETFLQEFDGGDKLEAMLFGNKIIYLTIQSALFVLNENKWDKSSLDDFREDFKKVNKLKDKNYINILEENEIIKTCINIQYFNLESETINVQKSYSFIVFRRGREIGQIDDEIIYNSDEEQGYCENFSLTSNAFLPKKVSISEILRENIAQQENEY